MPARPPSSANSGSSPAQAGAARNSRKANDSSVFMALSLEAGLDRQIGAALMVAQHDVAQIGQSGGDGEIFGRQPGREKVVGVLLLGDGEVAGLGAQFDPGREVAAEEIGQRALELRGITSMLVA